MPGFGGPGSGSIGAAAMRTPGRAVGFPTPHFAQRNYVLSGTTVDVNGVVLGGVTIKLFSATTDLLVAQTVSHATLGTWSFVVERGLLLYTVQYKAGPPDLYGSSLNTLAGV
jgi:hypothetical protein